jgi:HEAT repeat protein
MALGAAFSACGRDEDRTDCDFWAEKLARSGEIEMALAKSGELKCKESLPVLKALFDQGLLLESVLQTAKEIGDPQGAAPIVKAALLRPETSRQAATLVREWKLADAKVELVKVLSDDKLMAARDAALPALLELDKPENNEDLLIALATADPDMQPIEINQRAIEELGKMGSKKAVPALVKAIYLRSMKGQEVFTMTRKALATIGDASVLDQVLAVLQGTNQEIKDYTRAQGLEPWELDATPKTVQILGDTLDPRIIEPFIAELQKEIEPPKEISDQAFERWSQDKSNRLRVITFALGHIGSETGLAALGALMKDLKKDTLNQRVNAGNVLAYIGSEAAQDLLITAWKDEYVEVLRAAMLQIVAMGLDDRRLAVWDEMLGIVPEGAPKPKKPVELSEAVKGALENNERIKTYIAVVRECKDDLKCWLGKAKSENQDEQVKALLVLGRARFPVSDEIKAALWEAFEKAPKPMVDTKRFALMGLTRLGNQADGDKMAQKGLELMAGDPFWGGELYGYGNGLKRRMLR